MDDEIKRWTARSNVPADSHAESGRYVFRHGQEGVGPFYPGDRFNERRRASSKALSPSVARIRQRPFFLSGTRVFLVLGDSAHFLPSHSSVAPPPTKGRLPAPPSLSHLEFNG